MKQVIFLLAITAISVSSRGQKGKLTYSLVNTNSKENTTGTNAFEDNTMSVIFLSSAKKIDFILKNKCASTIKVVWDDAAFIDANGISQKVFHDGVKLIDRTEAQPATVIPVDAQIMDGAIPVNNVKLLTGQYSQWIQKELVPDLGEKTKKEKVADQEGKIFKLLLPVQIGDVKKEYLFSFKLQFFEN